MRHTIVAPRPEDVEGQDLFSSAVILAQKWLPFGLRLLVPFVIGLLVGVAFAWIIRRRGWRAQVISTWPIAVMFGSLAYVMAPAILHIATGNLQRHGILAGIVGSLIVTWPIWLVMGPVLYVYIAYLKRREKWLRDSTVVYLAAFSSMSECAYVSWMLQ